MLLTNRCNLERFLKDRGYAIIMYEGIRTSELFTEIQLGSITHTALHEIINNLHNLKVDMYRYDPGDDYRDMEVTVKISGTMNKDKPT